MDIYVISEERFVRGTVYIEPIDAFANRDAAMNRMEVLQKVYGGDGNVRFFLKRVWLREDISKDDSNYLVKHFVEPEKED